MPRRCVTVQVWPAAAIYRPGCPLQPVAGTRQGGTCGTRLAADYTGGLWPHLGRDLRRAWPVGHNTGNHRPADLSDGIPDNRVLPPQGGNPARSGAQIIGHGHSNRFVLQYSGKSNRRLENVKKWVEKVEKLKAGERKWQERAQNVAGSACVGGGLTACTESNSDTGVGLAEQPTKSETAAGYIAAIDAELRLIADNLATIWADLAALQGVIS